MVVRPNSNQIGYEAERYVGTVQYIAYCISNVRHFRLPEWASRSLITAYFQAVINQIHP